MRNIVWSGDSFENLVWVIPPCRSQERSSTSKFCPALLWQDERDDQLSGLEANEKTTKPRGAINDERV